MPDPRGPNQQEASAPSMRRMLSAFQFLIEWILSDIPGPVGSRLRTRYWRSRMGSVGSNVTFGVGVRVTEPKSIFIGDNTWIDDYVVLLAGPPKEGGRQITRRENASFSGCEGELHIGRNCHIAQFVTLQGHGGLSIGDDCGVASGARLYSLSHHYRAAVPSDVVYKFSPRSPVSEQALIASPVVMEDWTAVGLNAVLLPGATLGRGTWVATLSLVTGPLPGHSVAGGTPAVVVKEIRPDPEAGAGRAR